MVAALAAVGIAVVAGGGWAVMSLLRTPGPPGTPGIPGTRPSGTSGVQSGVATSGGELRTVQEVLDAARTAIDQERAASAEGMLRSAVDRFPGDQRLRFMLGECLLALGKGAEAYEQYDHGIMIGPDHAEYRHAAATIAAQLGRLDEAEAHYLVAQRLAPSNPKFPLYLAQVQRKQGKNDEARANLVMATALEPELAIAWGSLAALALEENRLSVGLGYVERARALEPTRSEWLVLEAKLLRRDNQPERALALLADVPVEARVKDAALLEEMALCHGMLGRAGEAGRLYVEALDASPERSELAYQAAVWFERSGERERARAFAHRARTLGHEGAAALLARVGE